jgi:hypothetical protein
MSELTKALDELLKNSSEQELAIIQDMLWKATRRDWHGVSDAANDMRVLEAG